MHVQSMFALQKVPTTNNRANEVASLVATTMSEKQSNFTKMITCVVVSYNFYSLFFICKNQFMLNFFETNCGLYHHVINLLYLYFCTDRIVRASTVWTSIVKMICHHSFNTFL